MPEKHLSHDEFFTRLGEAFASRKGKDHGTVFLSQKRLAYDTGAPLPSKEAPTADLKVANDQSYPILVRATNGKSGDKIADKKKLSTVVQADALDQFYSRYAEVCKAGMLALKPRDRSKRKTKAKKKKAAAA